MVQKGLGLGAPLKFTATVGLDCVVSDLLAMLDFTLTAAAVFAAVVAVSAETHTVHFTNNCGFGTPTLVQNGPILSTGADFTSNGPLISAIAFLQTGGCGLNGEGCSILETTLMNPTTPGSGSCTEVLLTPPFEFTVTIGFAYFNGCDSAGFDCTSADCSFPFQMPGQPLEVCCQADNVDLAITFCD